MRADRSRATPTRSAAPRLLFASYHCLIDPSSGAAVSARELLRLLRRAGWDVRALCGPAVDFEHREDVRQLLADQHLPFGEFAAVSGNDGFRVVSYRDDEIPSSAFLPPDPHDRVPSRQTGALFLRLLVQAWSGWRPDVLLTYGGYWMAVPMLRRARERGIRTVFWLRNFAYRDAGLFDLVDLTLVPSRYSAQHYREALGIETAVIPSPIDWSRVQCDRHRSQRYVTFVNPQPEKGVFVFARIAERLYRRRPDIALLIVEGRSGVQWLENTGLDLSGLTNLHVMANTPDPRDFYRVSHVLLMPSLCGESFGRVAAEATINGIPVLGTTRGALPELLDGAGFLFDVPERYTPESRAAPTADEVEPWVETVIRLWDWVGYDSFTYRIIDADSLVSDPPAVVLVHTVAPTVDLDIAGMDETTEDTIGGLVVKNADGNNAPRKEITLSAQPANWNGNVVLTQSGGVRVFSAATAGTEITFNGTDNVFAANTLPRSLYVEGVTESGEMRDVELKLEAQGLGQVASDTVKFTVLWVSQVDVSFEGELAQDNSAREAYRQVTVADTYDMGLQQFQNPDLRGWGLELRGLVSPPVFEYPLCGLQLDRDWQMRMWDAGGNPVGDPQEFSESIPPGNDTSPLEHRDDIPTDSDPYGAIYDWDTPGVTTGIAPAATVRRYRANFKAFASVVVDGQVFVRASPITSYYVRMSIKQIDAPQGDNWVLLNDVPNDNTPGMGPTNLTWNLQ